MHAQGEVSGTLPLLPVALLALAIAYVVLAARARRLGGAAQNAASEAELQVVRRIVGWPLRRTAVFLTGVGVTLWALLGPLAAAAHDGFTGHMAQHLLVGMLGPFLVVLGAPVTLLLRWGPPQWRRTVGRTLHLPVARWLAHPVVALVLSVGTLPLLYGTGVYAAAAHNPWLHTLMHAHFFASGYLFAWVIAGPDPAPARPSAARRLVVLGVAVAVHATVSQLMYAGVLPVGSLAAGMDPADLRRGAILMYYGGDLIELALAVALVSQWRPARRSTGRPGAAALSAGWFRLRSSH